MKQNVKKHYMLAAAVFLLLFNVVSGASNASAESQHGRVIKQLVTDAESGEQDFWIEYIYNDSGLLAGKYWYLGKEEEHYYFEEYDYYENDMLRTKRRSGIFSEFHYDSYGHYMDCDSGVIDPSGVPYTGELSDIVHEYDKKGNLTRYEVQWTYEDSPGEIYSIVRKYEYDEENRIARVISVPEDPYGSCKQEEFESNYMESSFCYWENGSYYVVIERHPSESRDERRGFAYIEYNKRGFPVKTVWFRREDAENPEISVDSKSSYLYDENGNLTQILIESRDGYQHTIDYVYQTEDGRPVNCDIIDSWGGGSVDPERTVYPVEYAYNENGEMVREGVNGYYRDYTYVYDEIAEPPAFLPENLEPFAPLYPWG